MTKPIRYYLNADREPVPAENQQEWSSWMQDAEQRTLASDRVNDSEVVTLFLGLDYGSDQPELFETVVKVGSIGPVTKRYPTYQSAIAGHDQIVFRLKSSLDQFLASLEWAGKKAL